MFTGLIEEIGIAERVDSIPGGKRILIAADKIIADLKIGDSVCTAGVCLTATAVSGKSFTVEAVGETLNKSTLIKITRGEYLNLERALKLNDRLGGHLVQGHVNGIGKIISIQKPGDNYLIGIEFDPEHSKYIVQEGSIAVDGISLTVARKNGNIIGISVIPHTWNNTTLRYKKLGGEVNLEVDIFAKYIENFLSENRTGKNSINENWLKNLGY